MDFEELERNSDNNRYQTQLNRIRNDSKETEQIEQAVSGALNNIKNNKNSFVIYGEPQSGKTEMMICLTAKLIDEGHRIVILLLNDSVDLLKQNLNRFTTSQISPTPQNYRSILDPSHNMDSSEWIIFCKKNGSDLRALIQKVDKYEKKIIIDDEADYASPNAKINRGSQTPINELITKLLEKNGVYIGVTATPARLDLNNTFDNKSKDWVSFPPHSYYNGQDTFFPPDLNEPLRFTLTELPEENDDNKYLLNCLFSFIVKVAHLNTLKDSNDQNYSMLIHTSGKKEDHGKDHKLVSQVFNALHNKNDRNYKRYWEKIEELAIKKYPQTQKLIIKYAFNNIRRNHILLINSENDLKTVDIEYATIPKSPFTVSIGGNIVSRGVTFENLLVMFFTRSVRHRMQADTFIQRARMFGSRGSYLEFMELHIPGELYLNWHRCFMYHRLHTDAVLKGRSDAVWFGDRKINPVAKSSIDQTNVIYEKGEMSFDKFHYTHEIESLVNDSSIKPLEKIESILKITDNKDVMPQSIVDFISKFTPNVDDPIAFHKSTSISNYKDADQDNISRAKQFMGQRDMEREKYKFAVHHFKIFYNAKNEGKLFYKYDAPIAFFKNTKNLND